MPQYGCLSLIADNCGGQNKNEDVLRFHLWLVEAGIFPAVRIIFLVKGHTKNACDRMFNLLKLDYHYRNIYTFDSMVEYLNVNEFVDVCAMYPKDFFDFHTTLDRYYRTLKDGETNRSHVFTILGNKNGSKPTILRKQDVHGGEERLDDLLPTKRNRKALFRSPQDRRPLIKNLLVELETLTPPGMRDIKAAQLYTKWRDLLPPEFRDITCPHLGDDILRKVKDEQNLKQTVRNSAAKKPTATIKDKVKPSNKKK